VSQLRKCVKLPTKIIDSQTIEIEPDLTYTEYPLRVLDTKERNTRRETVRMYKIQWNHHIEEEATWETEFIFSKISQTSSESISDIDHPTSSVLESRDKILFRGEGCNIQVIREQGH
jgi:hypothetical protein